MTNEIKIGDLETERDIRLDAGLEMPHLEFQSLDAGVAAHNRISGAICFLPSPTSVWHNKNVLNTAESLLDKQAMAGLENAGLFQKIRYPFPFPVGFSKTSKHVSLVCAFGHRTALLQCPNVEILDIFRAALGPFLVSETATQPNSDFIALQYHGDGFGVYVNSRPVFGQCEFPLARHFVLREIAISLAGRQQVSATFHAGAVGTDEKAVVFAAGSGSGKSTLTAAMAAAGFVYYSDDHCALVGDDGRVCPYPTRIGLKEGSWALPDLKSYAIGSIKPTFAGDGYVKQVTPLVAADPAETSRIAAFVFPAYSRNSDFRLTELSKLDALQRLFESGARLTGRYPTIRPLTKTLENVPAYELAFSQTAPAMDAVADMLAG